MIHGKVTQADTALTPNAAFLHDMKVIIFWPRVMCMYVHVFSGNVFPEEGIF